MLRYAARPIPQTCFTGVWDLETRKFVRTESGDIYADSYGTYAEWEARTLNYLDQLHKTQDASKARELVNT